MDAVTLNLSRFRPWIAAMGLAFSSIAAANCGLDACPISAQPVTGKPMGSLLTDFRFTNVGSDHYTETTLGGQINLGHRMALGARIPFIALSQANVETTGMGNAVGFGNWSILNPESRPSMDLGLQLEIPTVSADELGDAHFLVLPTARIGWNDPSWAFSVAIGYSRVLDNGHSEHDGHHHHGHSHSTATSIVNPHASSELLVRGDVGVRWSTPMGTLQSGMRLDGIQALDEGTTPGPFASAGPVIQFTTGRVVSEVTALLPITRHTRYSSRVVARILWTIPQ